jgi:hypothetical protein
MRTITIVRFGRRPKGQESGFLTVAKTRKDSGTYEIDNAEELFRRSVANKKTDYRYVAMAIGQNPLEPPDWAIRECVQARTVTEQEPSLRPPGKSGGMLDQIIIEFLKHRDAWEFRCWQFKRSEKAGHTGLPDKPEPYIQLKFAEACRRAWKIASGINTEPTRGDIEDYQDAWNREQEEELTDWELERDKVVARDDLSDTEKEAQLDCLWGHAVPYKRGRGTKRIERVAERYRAEVEAGMFSGSFDQDETVWLNENFSTYPE